MEDALAGTKDAQWADWPAGQANGPAEQCVLDCCGRVRLISPEHVGLSWASRINLAHTEWVVSSRFIPSPLDSAAIPALESVLVGSSPRKGEADDGACSSPRSATSPFPPLVSSTVRAVESSTVRAVESHPALSLDGSEVVRALARASPHPSCSGNLMVFVCALDELVAAANREGSHPHLRVQLHDRFLFLAVLA